MKRKTRLLCFAMAMALTVQLLASGIGSAAASAPQTEAVQSLAAGDAYEPNDSMSQAKALTSPLWFYADLHTSTDADWYRFTLDKPTALTASFTFGGFFSGGADYDLELLGADGATLAVSARSSAWLSDEYLSATLPAGSYYWKVRCSNGRLSSYGYSVQATATEIDSYEPNDSPATAKPIGMRPYSWSSGTIHSLTDKDYFKLTLSQPTWIKGTLTYIPSGTNYDLSLVDEAGNVLAKSANAGTADESFKLNLAAGTYYFVVQSASGTSSSPYKLAYSPPWPDSNEWNDTLETAKTLASVPYGALGVGTLHTASDVDYFKFTVDRLSSVSGKLDVPSGENFELALLDGGGTPLIASYKSGSEDELIQTELPQGTYYWRIYAGSVTDSEAYYSLDSKVTVIKPRDRVVAEYWAPDFYQDVDTDSDYFRGLPDLIANFDLDGDMEESNNFSNARSLPFKSYVYYSVVETETHYFIGYYLYYPAYGFKGVFLMVYKDGSPYGKLQAVNTNGGENGRYSDGTVGPTDKPIKLTNHRPVFYASTGASSDIWGNPKWFDGPMLTMFDGKLDGSDSPPGGDGVRYYYNGAAQQVGDKNGYSPYSYELLPLEPVYKDQIKKQTEINWGIHKNYMNADGRSGNPPGEYPWGFSNPYMQEYLVKEGDVLSDPVYFFDTYFWNLGAFSTKYVDNDFFNVELRYQSVTSVKNADGNGNDLVLYGPGLSHMQWKKNDTALNESNPIWFGGDQAEGGPRYEASINTRYFNYWKDASWEIDAYDKDLVLTGDDLLGSFTFSLSPGERNTWLNQPLARFDGEVYAKIDLSAYRKGEE
ncbi:pre-peptidase C-terminal domain-containing protein [Cohnella sp. OV330]|uniref:pre-peptidase C-terminal domain-containing protein n=1 Tax=Cohnella sp. OV330 TaxID=1855288 RepID=UPI0008EF4098|nr:pre-peptidase C-terminal domain-containing protein [Cohnella sp. OV330]SFB44878.1 pre-peptidase C-terminal domain-containing protein [Cohnella sp. OV330]